MHNVRCILKPSFLDSSQLAFVVQPVSINNQYWIQEQGYNQTFVVQPAFDNCR